MADDFRIQISAELKSSDLENIKSQINGLKTTPVKLNIDTKDVQTQISNIKKQIESLGNVRINLNGSIGSTGGAGIGSVKKSVDDISKAYNDVMKLQSKISSIHLKLNGLDTVKNAEQVEVLRNQLNRLVVDWNTLLQTFNGRFSINQDNNLDRALEETSKKFDVVNAKARDTQKNLANGIQLKIDNGTFENQISSIESKFKSLNTENERVSVGIQKLKDLLKNMNGNSDIKSVVKDYESFKQTLTSVTNQVSEMQKVSKQTATAQQTLTNSQTLSNNIQTWMNNNTKAAQQFGVQLKDLQSQLNNNTNPAVLKNCSAEFNKIQSEAKAAGVTVSSFANSLKSAVLSAVGLSSLTTAFYTGIRYIKQSVSTIVELDNALVDLQKTATATKTQLNDFYFNANDVAKEYGASTQEIIQSAADWSRSGYNLNDSKLMAQYSSMFKSISPGMDIDTATTSLVSIMKAYGIEAENVLDGVMSKINKVGKIIALDNYIG